MLKRLGRPSYLYKATRTVSWGICLHLQHCVSKMTHFDLNSFDNNSLDSTVTLKPPSTFDWAKLPSSYRYPLAVVICHRPENLPSSDVNKIVSNIHQKIWYKVDYVTLGLGNETNYIPDAFHNISALNESSSRQWSAVSSNNLATYKIHSGRFWLLSVQ